jgi:hypothetical protein
MSAVFVVSEKKWDNIHEKMLSSKVVFLEHLKSIIADCNGEKIIIFLPPTVTKKERHQVHLYSKKNQISGVSANYNDKRVMKIVLESAYVKQLLLK